MSKELMRFLVFLCVVVFSAFFTTPLYADPPPDAEIISLKKNCGTDVNCFTSPGTMLNWIWNTRNPTASSPLLVEIGPGQWNWVSETCNNRGHVTFKGSGRNNTILIGASGAVYGTQFTNCQSISFQDLRITSNFGAPHAIGWFGGGSSSWTNVQVDATYSAWYDTNPCAPSRGRHDWFSSTLSSAGSFVVLSRCGDSWFWGSELRSSAQGLDAETANSQMHLYGSNVRVISTQTSGTLVGLNAIQGGTIHFHGGEIAVRSENPSANVSVVGVQSDGAGSLVHTHMTSYGLLPTGTGVATRLSATNGGKAEAPFEWTAGTLVPTPGDATGTKHIVSLDGQDKFVETDCPLNAGCQNPGNYPHEMLYSNSCTGTGITKGPWFDLSTNKCRGE